jgi:hypothetical protein
MPHTNPWLIHVAAVRKEHPQLRKDVVAITKLAKKSYKPAATPVVATKAKKVVKVVKVKKAKKAAAASGTVSALVAIRKALMVRRMKGGAHAQQGMAMPPVSQQAAKQMAPAAVTSTPMPVSGGGLLSFLTPKRSRSRSPKRSSLFSRLKKLVKPSTPKRSKSRSKARRS